MRLRKGANLFITLFLCIGAVMSFFPIYLAIINSVKTQGEMFASFTALPTKLHFENYSQAFSKINLLSSTLNSVVVSVIGIGGIIFCAAWPATSYPGPPADLARRSSRYSLLPCWYRFIRL